MRLIRIVIALCLACLLLPVQAQEMEDSLVYIGTRAAAAEGGPRQGIYAARLDSETGELEPLGLQLELERAIWLNSHPTLPIIYSLARITGDPDDGDSSILGFAVDSATGGLRLISEGSLGIGLATQFDLDMDSMTIFTAGMESGEISASPIYADGSLGDAVSVQKHSGSGPHRRQAGPRAHGITQDPSGRYVISPGFGSDKIYVHRFDPETRQLSPADPPFVIVPPGSGARHALFHPNGRFLYVNMELTADIRIYGWDAEHGTMKLLGVQDTYPEDYAGDVDRSVSEIAFSADGRFFYIALRGDQDSIVRYAVDAENGELEEVQRISTQGVRPWYFGIDPTGRWMVVANSDSNSVDVLSIDPATGELAATGHSIEVPSAGLLTFYRN